MVWIVTLLLYAAIGRLTYTYLGGERVDARTESQYQECLGRHSAEYKSLCRYSDYVGDHSSYYVGGAVWPIVLPAAFAIRNYKLVIGGAGALLAVFLFGSTTVTLGGRTIRIINKKWKERRERLFDPREAEIKAAHAALVREAPELARELEEV